MQGLISFENVPAGDLYMLYKKRKMDDSDISDVEL
jgi:hypothetical protein